ncbi:hypothetical protein [Streptomyces sp. MUM 136J]|uniref:hypothetical protein n=1 Tax=Streptomyces sp. MUM 136J TaxID=2791992 RepID=UPI001F044E0B|nr:hypothetical protein [Streptomyces sp. MUM 136J]
MEVAGDNHRAAFVGGDDDALERLGGGLIAREPADVVDDDEVQRVIFATALEVVLSTVALPRRAVGDSRVNQATCMPWSMAL